MYGHSIVNPVSYGSFSVGKRNKPPDESEEKSNTQSVVVVLHYVIQKPKKALLGQESLRIQERRSY